MTRPMSFGNRPASAYGRGVWGIWAFVRLAGVVVMTGRLSYPQTDLDVMRYWGWASAVQAGHLPWSSFPLEYPPGILPFLALPGGQFGYELQFIVLALAADGIVLAMLRRRSARGLGQWVWLVAPIALGTTFWLRLDVFVAAALVGFIVAIQARRWRTAGLCLAYATLLKLWPLVLLVVVWRLIPASGRRQVCSWCVGLIAAFTVPVLAWGGSAGLVSMLRYQGGRGLEVESVAAYPVMLAWKFGHHASPAFAHDSIEFAVAGLAAHLAAAALPCALLLVVGLVWRDNGSRVTIASATLLVAVTVLIASKTMSPQYLVWILALISVAVCDDTARGRRSTWALAVLSIAATALTQAIYPWHWMNLVLFAQTSGIVLLTLRLALLVAVTVLAGWHAFGRRQNAPVPPVPPVTTSTPTLSTPTLSATYIA
ncbi:MAG TPA: glycosyltransferase 87 family protein [Mycobacteriales bacterium]|nr:glycosyltransferase 87 family protein [Mycobacteriales bacterium]